MRGRLALIGVGVCWAFTPLFVVLASWDPFGTVLVRAVITGGALLTLSRFEWSKLRGRAFLGGLFAAASTSLFAASFLFAAAGKVYVLYYTFPLLLMCWDCVVRKRMPAAVELGGLILAMLGLVVIFEHDVRSSSLGWGALIAFLSAVCWVAHILIVRSAKPEDNICIGNGAGQLLVAVLFLPYVAQAAQLPTGIQSAALGALGLCSFLALYLWSVGIREVDGHLAGIITMLEAPGGVLLMLLLHKTALPFSLMLGGLLVLAAAAIALCCSGRKA